MGRRQIYANDDKGRCKNVYAPQKSLASEPTLSTDIVLKLGKAILDIGGWSGGGRL
jgi:hypothetical protein